MKTQRNALSSFRTLLVIAFVLVSAFQAISVQGVKVRLFRLHFHWFVSVSFELGTGNPASTWSTMSNTNCAVLLPLGHDTGRAMNEVSRPEGISANPLNPGSTPSGHGQPYTGHGCTQIYNCNKPPAATPWFTVWNKSSWWLPVTAGMYPTELYRIYATE